MFELPGFRQNVRENIQVVLGQTISVDAQLQVGGLTENVVVTGASPVVDASTTKIGTSLKGEELIGVPNSTDGGARSSEAPGVRMQGFDVGGSHKSQQSGYESVRRPEPGARRHRRYQSHRGRGRHRILRGLLRNEEVSISALGADVEMNSPGAAIVTTIKSGGNAFKGLEHLSYEPGSFVGSNGDPSTSAGAAQLPAERQRHAAVREPEPPVLEGHTNLGSPIKRDKVWFYAAYNRFKIDKVVAGVDQERRRRPRRLRQLHRRR